MNAPAFAVIPQEALVRAYQGSYGSTLLFPLDFEGFDGPVSYAVNSALPPGVTALEFTSSTHNASVMTFIAAADAEVMAAALVRCRSHVVQVLQTC